MNIKKFELGEACKVYFMPYAMKVIVDRALPDVRDGFKPIHRRIIYKMKEKNMVVDRSREKCNYIVGEILKIHPHGNTSVYGALAKLTNQYDGDLHPFVDGEGAFGKKYLADSPSADRYTYARLNKFSEEFFKGINKNAVQFLGNEKDHIQPVVLPTTFPNILVKTNDGIAVGYKCFFPSFNLIEVCNLTEAYINDKNINVSDYLKAPDFSTGGEIIYSKEEMEKIFKTGLGSIRIRAKHRYNSENNSIEIYEIPYNCTANTIIFKITELIKNGKLNKVTDVIDSTGFNKETEREELKITIELKKNADVESIIQYLYKSTKLENSISIRMNCLVNNEPKTLGIKEILDEWLAFRRKCILNELNFDLDKYTKELEFLRAIVKVFSNTDKTISILRKSKTDDIVIKSLCEEYGINENEANYVSDLKIKNISEEYYRKNCIKIGSLEGKICELNCLINNETMINKRIKDELNEIKTKYGTDRRTTLIGKDNIIETKLEEIIDDSNCYVVLTRKGYLKKLNRKSDNIKILDDDYTILQQATTNDSTVLIFTDKGCCYKAYLWQYEECKPSAFGTFIQTSLGLQKDEKIISAVVTKNYDGSLINIFENGKLARINMKAFSTKSKRVKLEKAINIDSNLVRQFIINNNIDIMCLSDLKKTIIVNTNEFNEKNNKNSAGDGLMKSKDNSILKECYLLDELNKDNLVDIEYYRSKRNAIGKFLKKTDKLEKIA